MAVESSMLALGTPAPSFTLPQPATGATVSLDELTGPALVVTFICNHCPYVQHVAAGLATLGRDLADQGVPMVGIAGEDLVDRPGRTCGDVLDRGQVTQAIENLGRGCRHIVTSFEEMRVSRAQSIGLRLVTKGILDECRVLLVQVASIRVVGPSRARRSAYALAERDPPARGLPNLSRRPKRRNQIRFRQSLGIPARYHEEPASRCSC